MTGRFARVVAGTAALAATAFAAGCGEATEAGADVAGKLAVVATTTQVADFARSIGGDRVAVTQILKANVDPHDYEPSPADITAFGRAKVLVRNGVGLENGWLDEAAQAGGFSGTVVDASQGVTLRAGGGEHAEEEHAGEEGNGEGGEESDPHVWHDVRNAKIMVVNIQQAFAAADPANAAVYAQNLADYSAKLDALDADIEAKIGSIPPAQRKLVTDHDALGYYIDRYGLEYVGSIIPSFDTTAELSGKEIGELVAKIRATGVKAIFAASSLPPRTAEAVGQQAGVTVVAGEDALYADTLGPEGSAGDTYLEAMAHNTDVIVKALA